MQRDFMFVANYSKDYEEICIYFEGIPKKENLDYIKIRQIAQEEIEKISIYDNIEQAIIKIKTIFKDFDESELEITTSISDNQHIHLLYTDNKLRFFINKDEIDKETIEISYTQSSGIEINISNTRDMFTPKIIDYLKNSLLNKILIVNNLKNIKMRKIEDLNLDTSLEETFEFSNYSSNEAETNKKLLKKQTKNY